MILLDGGVGWGGGGRGVGQRNTCDTYSIYLIGSELQQLGHNGSDWIRQGRELDAGHH